MFEMLKFWDIKSELSARGTICCVFIVILSLDSHNTFNKSDVINRGYGH